MMNIVEDYRNKNPISVNNNSHLKSWRSSWTTHKNDSRYFSQTSDEPYDRHHYKIVSKHYATFIVESWDEVQEWWWNHCNMINFDARIEVLDKPKKTKGFK